MKEIHIDTITSEVEKLCIDACCNIGDDVYNSLKKAMDMEESPSGLGILHQLIENIEISRRDVTPICQDTGMAVFFLELGQDIHITSGYLYDAINEGVRRGYTKGYLRKSVVLSGIDRINTMDNTPAIIHTSIVPGDKLKITFAPKGFGSENMSAIKMLKPSDGIKGIKDFVFETVNNAGSNPCPPIILGIGLGGTFEKCALLSKQALLRNLDEENPDPNLALLEKEILNEVNNLGIGPQGLGGRVTCLGVSILSYPTHIAGMPVAVNIQCHASRHKEIIL
ncbi:L(+)-tartrate dehydratase subunit alpha [Oxobacter pfennigii]|uniref:L(+)-tartrate dehydratase subunit alpha n=1 Tax=Oxobacter pfennigii TaxID=36849 RepID=A0A0P8Y863_9CLOT|nr:fumarate hydratase [Oxobacter pfennigii]KPU42850.1 L(+)-tartrate dehydratase subunit alpha [Oxobacter pfennigii]